MGNSRLAALLGCAHTTMVAGEGGEEAGPAARTGEARSSLSSNGMVVLGRDLLKKWEREGGTVGWVVVDGEAVAVWSVADRIREEAPYVVAELQEMGVGIMMLTGDNAGAAKHVGETVGLAPHDICYQLLPHEKVSRVHELTRAAGVRDVEQTDLEEGGGDAAGETSRCCGGNVGICVLVKDKVGMAGDGVNDAPALASAHVGMAMGAAGSTVAMETADVVLMDSNLNKIPAAVSLGRDTLSKIRQNIAIAIITKAVMIGLTVADMSTLWLAIVSDVGAMLLVTINGMGLLSSSRRPGQSPAKPARKCAAAAAATAVAGEHASERREEESTGLEQMGAGSDAFLADFAEEKPAAAAWGAGAASLSEEQQDMMEALMERTGLQEMAMVRAILEESEWQLHKAIKAYRLSKAAAAHPPPRKAVSNVPPASEMPVAAQPAVVVKSGVEKGESTKGGGCSSKKGC